MEKLFVYYDDAFIKNDEWKYCSLVDISERKSACFEDEESELFIEVDCFNVEPVLCLAPEGLSQQQVINTSFNLYLS